MSERGDKIRRVTVTLLVEDATDELADEFVQNLNGEELEAATAEGRFVGVVQKVEAA